MTWTRYDAGATKADGSPDPGGAVEILVAGSHVGWLSATSKCTINLYEWYASSGSPFDRLCMFGVTADEVKSQFEDVPIGTWDNIQKPWGLLVDNVLDGVSVTHGSDEAPIAYISTQDETALFTISGGAVAGSEPLRSTIIPSKKSNQEWYYTGVYYGSTEPVGASDEGTVSNVWNIRDIQGTFTVLYKDPCVIHLPNSMGWLMLLCRVRYLPGGDPGSPNGGLSDIVAYWADEDDPGFERLPEMSDGVVTRGVTGPYWIANSINTFGSSVTAGVRFWLSVPSGAVISSGTSYSLAVYFVVEATSYLTDYERFGTTNYLAYVYSRLSAYDRSTAGYFQSCIGVHVIDLDDLSNQRSSGNYGNEREWAYTATDARYKVPRTVGRLSLWLDDGTGRPGTELVEESDFLKIVDPQCGRCSLDSTTIGTLEYIRFFNSTIARTAHPYDPAEMADWASHWLTTTPVLLGLWMARPCATGEFSVERMGGSYSSTVAGFDFILSDNTPFEQGSIISAGPPPSAWQALDPDPVRLSDGTWRVYFGVNDDSAESRMGLMYFDYNSDMEVCESFAVLPWDFWRIPFDIHYHAEYAGIGFRLNERKP